MIWCDLTNLSTHNRLFQCLTIDNKDSWYCINMTYRVHYSALAATGHVVLPNPSSQWRTPHPGGINPWTCRLLVRYTATLLNDPIVSWFDYWDDHTSKCQPANSSTVAPIQFNHRRLVPFSNNNSTELHRLPFSWCGSKNISTAFAIVLLINIR